MKVRAERGENPSSQSPRIHSRGRSLVSAKHFQDHLTRAATCSAYPRVMEPESLTNVYASYPDILPQYSLHLSLWSILMPSTHVNKRLANHEEVPLSQP